MDKTINLTPSTCRPFGDARSRLYHFYRHLLWALNCTLFVQNHKTSTIQHYIAKECSFKHQAAAVNVKKKWCTIPLKWFFGELLCQKCGQTITFDWSKYFVLARGHAVCHDLDDWTPESQRKGLGMTALLWSRCLDYSGSAKQCCTVPSLCEPTCVCLLSGHRTLKRVSPRATWIHFCVWCVCVRLRFLGSPKTLIWRD